MKKELIKSLVIELLLVAIIVMGYNLFVNKYRQEVWINNKKVLVKCDEKFPSGYFSNADIDKHRLFRSCDCLYFDERDNKYELMEDDLGNYFIFHDYQGNGKYTREMISKEEALEIFENL